MARATKAERELERALFPMRRELRVLESRLHGLKARESRIGTKRAREGEGEDLAQAAPKRLRSEVVAPTPSAPAPAPAPRDSETSDRPRRDPPVEAPREERKPVAQNDAEKQRNRRLFGNLLVGTLSKARQGAQAESESKTTQVRKEMEQELEQKLVAESKKINEEQAERDAKRREEVEKSLQTLVEEIKIKEQKLNEMRKERQDWLLSGFLKTKAEPAIYYRPAKTDEFTEKVLGLKERVPRATDEEKANAEEEHEEEEEDEEGEEGEEHAEEREPAQEEKPKDEAEVVDVLEIEAKKD